jgi:hypothetical protein
LHESLLAEAVAAAQGLRNETARSKALAALAPYVRDDLLAEALCAARQILSKRPRSEALSALAPHLLDPERGIAWVEAFEAADRIDDEGNRLVALARVGPYLASPRREIAMAAAMKGARHISYRYLILPAVTPYLSEPERQTTLAKALDAAKSICFERDRAESLVALASVLPEPLLVQGLSAAQDIADDQSRRIALSALTTHLPEPARSLALPDILVMCQRMVIEPDRSKAILSIVSHMKLLPFQEQAGFWRGCLRALASQGRTPIFQAQEDLLRLLKRLTEADASAEVVEIAHAIRDVGRWFP